MLWGQSKKIKETLDTILFHVRHMDESLRGMRDQFRQERIDHMNHEIEMRGKLEKVSNEISALKPKGKGGRKKKEAPTA